jgi:hypothetical protein
MGFKKERLAFLLLAVFVVGSFATHKCVWVRGVVRCNKNSAKQTNVEVRVYDRDGVSLFQMFDPDDLMGVSFTDEDGTFQLDGCGDDFDWFPGVQNLPEPFLQIRHYCNSDKGETIELPEFNTFVPDTYDIGVIELDEVAQTTTYRTAVTGIEIAPDRAPSRSPKFGRKIELPIDETEHLSTEKYVVTEPDTDQRFALLRPDEVVLGN